MPRMWRCISCDVGLRGCRCQKDASRRADDALPVHVRYSPPNRTSQECHLSLHEMPLRIGDSFTTSESPTLSIHAEGLHYSMVCIVHGGAFTPAATISGPREIRLFLCETRSNPCLLLDQVGLMLGIGLRCPRVVGVLRCPGHGA